MGRIKIKTIACLVVGFVLVVVCWWWRNWEITGNPFFNLGNGGYKMFTLSSPEYSVLRQTTLQAFDRIPSLKQLVLKWGKGSEIVYSQLLFFTGSFLSAFFWIALITPFRDRKWSRINFFIFGCLLMGICRYIICDRRVDDLNLIIPVAILAGTAAFLLIWGKLPPSRKGLKLAMLVLFLVLNLFPYFSQLHLTPKSQNPTKNNLIQIGGKVAEGEVILSDLPWFIAWYTQKESLWIPAVPDEVSALISRFPEIKYIHLTPGIHRYGRTGTGMSWTEIYQNRIRSPFWKTGEIVCLSGEQFIAHIISLQK